MEPITAITLPLSDLAQVSFLVTLLIVIIFSIILYYHWEQYAISKQVKNITYIAYSVITIPLISLMGILTFIL